MKLEKHEILWLTTYSEFSLPELAQYSGLSEAEIQQYVDEGAIVPIDPNAPQPVFSAHYRTTLRAAYRLQNDFELTPQELAIIITLLKRIHQLETQLQTMDIRRPFPALE